MPFANVGTTVDLRITDREMQAYRGTERITSHLLLLEGAANEYRTNDADLPAGGNAGNGTRLRRPRTSGSGRALGIRLRLHETGRHRGSIDLPTSRR
ncbi:hypothetical protein RKD54_004558 [Pseudarthrobacter sp. SLBN-100]|uniref:hypothetical protein n=1 Tax=Arthrobacter sp. SLBN-100 TaxID=2768450 RepID=UPI00114D4ECF|nr:hypothetical protein [Arthrobacter sp. SLBN-100]